MTTSTVLIVDDESAIRDMLRMALEIAEFRCIEAENIQEAFTLIVDERPDIILLDWMLPGGSGLELLRRMKRDDSTSDVPVIMITAKTAEDNIIQGLDVGADDYIVKPFAPRELIARVKALLRRSGGGREEARIQVEGLVLDGESRRIFIGEQAVDMGPTEFNLLHFFMSHPERAYTRGQLLDQVRIRIAIQNSHADLIEFARLCHRFKRRLLQDVAGGAPVGSDDHHQGLSFGNGLPVGRGVILLDRCGRDTTEHNGKQQRNHS